jgi:hypothetical protein
MTLKQCKERTIPTRVGTTLNERGEYLHKSCRLINEVDLSTDEERGQMTMFNNECEGYCGV